MNSQKNEAAKPEPLKPVSLWHMIKLGIGLIPHGHFEYISDTFISALARGFVGNASQVGYIQAFNPLFGFLVQPVIGWLGDHTWTRIGRRKPYLLFSLPWILVAFIAMPLAPKLVPFVVAVVIYQFFVDMYAVSCSTMMPETVPLQQRSTQSAVSAIVGSALAVCAMLFVAPLYDKNHLYPFAFAALITTASTAMLLFGITEHYHGFKKRPALYKAPAEVVKWAFENRNIRKLFLIILFGSYGNNSVGAFRILFMSRTLGVSVGKAASIGFIGPLVGAATAVPLGYLADRYGRKNMMLFANLVGVVATVIGLAAYSLNQMYFHFFVGAIGATASAVSLYPLMTQFMPRDRIGTISGAIPLFYGSARLLAMLTAGRIIDAFGENYRVIWVIALVCAIPCLALVLSIDTSQDVKERDAKEVGG